MREVVIVDGVRSAFTNFGGALRSLASVDIAAHVVNGLLDRTGILERGTVDSLMAGCALGDMKCRDAARYIVLQSNLPLETSGTFVEMQCGSAITSLNHAAWRPARGSAAFCRLFLPAAGLWAVPAALFCAEPLSYRMLPDPW